MGSGHQELPSAEAVVNAHLYPHVIHQKLPTGLPTYRLFFSLASGLPSIKEGQGLENPQSSFLALQKEILKSVPSQKVLSVIEPRCPP